MPDGSFKLYSSINLVETQKKWVFCFSIVPTCQLPHSWQDQGSKNDTDFSKVA